MTRKRVLFICSHNAARSRMAEGYLRARYGDRFEPYSAGTQVSTISHDAIKVMQEIGVDISGQRSKPLMEFAAWRWMRLSSSAMQQNRHARSFPGQRRPFMPPSGTQKSSRGPMRRSSPDFGKSGTRSRDGSTGTLRERREQDSRIRAIGAVPPNPALSGKEIEIRDSTFRMLHTAG